MHSSMKRKNFAYLDLADSDMMVSSSTHKDFLQASVSMNFEAMKMVQGLLVSSYHFQNERSQEERVSWEVHR